MKVAYENWTTEKYYKRKQRKLSHKETKQTNNQNNNKKYDFKKKTV